MTKTIILDKAKMEVAVHYVVRRGFSDAGPEYIVSFDPFLAGPDLGKANLYSVYGKALNVVGRHCWQNHAGTDWAVCGYSIDAVISDPDGTLYVSAELMMEAVIAASESALEDRYES